LVAKMARYIILKGQSGEPIPLSKLNEDVLGEKYRKMRLSKQVMIDADAKLRGIFGMRLIKAPADLFPQARFKDCFYLVNSCCV
jgi:hypothetical protein